MIDKGRHHFNDAHREGNGACSIALAAPSTAIANPTKNIWPLAMLSPSYQWQTMALHPAGS